jgi:hypothetical protein
MAIAFSIILEGSKGDNFIKTRQESKTHSKLETSKPPTYSRQTIRKSHPKDNPKTR